MNEPQEPQPSDIIWLGPIEAAEHLKVSAPLLKRLRLKGEGPAYARLSDRMIRYRVVDLDTWATERLSK